MPARRAARVRCVIPQALCDRNRTEQENFLTALPNELQTIVWSNLTEDADRSCLALSCKANANFYNSLKPPPESRRLSGEQRITFLLRLQAFSAHRNFRLCFKCRKFKLLRSGWGGMTKFLKSRSVNREMAIKGPNCPSCVKESRQATQQIRKTSKAKGSLKS